MIGFAAQRLMELEVGSLTGAGYGQKSVASARAQRNGYRERAGRPAPAPFAQLGDAQLKGQLLPGLLEPRRLA